MSSPARRATKSPIWKNALASPKWLVSGTQTLWGEGIGDSVNQKILSHNMPIVGEKKKTSKLISKIPPSADEGVQVKSA